jgi:hypothetical protein
MLLPIFTKLVNFRNKKNKYLIIMTNYITGPFKYPATAGRSSNLKVGVILRSYYSREREHMFL